MSQLDRFAELVRDPDFTLYQGDVLDVLRSLPEASIDCCVTSPPYWGLRDYGTGRWEGGDPDCSHSQGKGGQGPQSKNPQADYPAFAAHRGGNPDECPRCGAVRIDQQLGLEATPEAYVARLVGVFAEVRRVLSDEGTLWLNLGDSYAGSWGAQSRPNGNDAKSGLEGGSMLSARQIAAHPKGGTHTGSLKNTPGLKPKDLVGIPWMVAFALRADGWYLRAENIWRKLNCMPESVKDRPTKAHEQVFLFTKSQRYFYDQEAVQEPFAPASEARYRYAFGGPKAEDLHRQDAEGPGGNRTAPIGKRTFPGMQPEAERGPDGRRKTQVEAGEASIQHRDGERWPNGGRNMRSVWDLPTQPYPGAHFAVFPEGLPRRCILAGCPKGGVVLDPFGGSGTTALVARKLGRRSVLIELNLAYAEMASQRLSQQSLLTEAV